MRILLLNQFYPPDPAPTGQVLHDLARVLVGRGHDVHVVCSAGGYGAPARHAAEERRDGVHVRRVAAPVQSRLAAHLAYLLGAAVKTAIRVPRPDVVLSLTTPPFLGWLGRVAAARGAARAEWIMDVYPDALASHGLVRDASLAARALGWAVRRQLSGARVVFTLGPAMAGRVAAHAGPRTEVVAVPLWARSGEADPADVRAVRARHGWSAGDLVLLYAGNMGLAHLMEPFLECARRTDPDTVWAFMGGGPRRREVEDFARRFPSARVQLLPSVGEAELPALLSAADVHLVSLRPAWTGVVVPSKLQAAFAAGRPVLFAGPGEGETARWIEESGGGWVVPPGDVDALCASVGEARVEAERLRRAAAGRAYAALHFDLERNAGAIAERLERLAP